MGSRDGMGLGDFLNESAGSSKGDWLKSWKENGSIVVWLHTRAKIHARFAHQFPYVEAREDKETRRVVRVLRSLKFGCWESDAVLAKARWRNQVTGEREVPPVICPLCLLNEAIMADTKLPDDAEIFHVEGRSWDGSEPREARYIKGNLTGKFARNKESWKQSVDVRKSYLFCVVPAENIDGGPKITEESIAIGEAVKLVIKQEMDSEGDEAGNPAISPYAFKWTYDAKAKSPKDFYKAYRFRQAKLTDEVRDQIISAEPPSIAQFCRRGDVFALRAYVEAALTDKAKKVIDIDACFTAAEAEAEREDGRGAAERRRTTDDVQDPMPSGSRRRKKTEPAKEPPGEPCDDCGAPMTKGQLKCGKCGAEYEDDSQPAQQTRRAEPLTRVPERAPEHEVDDDLPF